jgi:heme-degrading monooxygenase HmoA
MVVSIVIRKTRVSDRQQWQERLERALPRILEVLRRQPGFLSVEYLWGVYGDGQMGQVTRWQTLEDCQRYVREGAAATVAAFEDLALPTAAHPDGTWLRYTFEVVDAEAPHS